MYLIYEAREEVVDHALFWCSRVARIWGMARFLSGVNCMVSPTQYFLDCTRFSLTVEHATFSAVQMAYVAYHIWLSRNSWVFVLERALV